MFKKSSGLVKYLLSALLLLCGAEAFSQTISGTVVDQDRQPLPGVSVILKGTTIGVMTDGDGKYSIKNSAGAKTLVFSCIGLKELEMVIGGRTTINVVMEEDANLLDETVVIGYQEVHRRDLMGAVSSTDNKDLRSVPTPNFSSALAGKLAGVEVKTTEGDPDADVQIRVRGTGSITQDGSPLYIVDGFPVNSISDINAQDIKSIDVLKDAFSTAIYGSRGALSVDPTESDIKMRYIDPSYELKEYPIIEGHPNGFNFADNAKLPWIRQTIMVKPSDNCTMGCFYKAVYSSMREGVPFPVKAEEALEVIRITEEVRRQNPEF